MIIPPSYYRWLSNDAIYGSVENKNRLKHILLRKCKERYRRIKEPKFGAITFVFWIKIFTASQRKENENDNVVCSNRLIAAQEFQAGCISVRFCRAKKPKQVDTVACIMGSTYLFNYYLFIYPWSTPERSITSRHKDMKITSERDCITQEEKKLGAVKHNTSSVVGGGDDSGRI